MIGRIDRVCTASVPRIFRGPIIRHILFFAEQAHKSLLLLNYLKFPLVQIYMQ
jgi:hypothetical protein